MNDSLGLARFKRQGKAGRLENTADISAWHDEVFAVLFYLNVLKPIEIHH